jgi:ABC-type sugar transport system ATPase subunit
MDEPLSNLDAKLRVQTRAEITRLYQRIQTTVIYVTHDQTEVNFHLKCERCSAMGILTYWKEN